MSENMKVLITGGGTVTNQIKDLLDKGCQVKLEITDPTNSGVLPENLIELVQEVEVGLKSSRPRIEDRVSYILELNDINEVRKASRSAYAKRAKATTEDLDWKYGEEIAAARRRLEELNKRIEEAEDPVAEAVALGEDDPGLVQRVINSFGDVGETFSKYLHLIKMTHKQAKVYLQGIDATQIPPEVMEKLNTLGDKYIEIYKDRIARADQRVLSLNRYLLFMAKFTPKYVHQNVVLNDGRGIYQITQAKARAKEKAKQERAKQRGKKK